MAIVLEDPRNFGGGLGNGLATLAQQKLDKIHRNIMIKEDSNQIQNLLQGISPQQAHALAYAKQTDPKIFQDVVKAYFLGGGFGGGQQEQQSDISALLGQLQGASQPQQEQSPSQGYGGSEQQSPLQSLNIPQQQSQLGFANQLNEGTLRGIFGNDQNLNNLLSSISGSQPSNIQAQQQVLNQKQPDFAKASTVGQQQPQQKIVNKQQEQQQPNKSRSFNEIIKKGLQNPALEIQERKLQQDRELAEKKAEQKEALEERKLQFKEELTAGAETKEIYDDTINQYEAAKASDDRLNRMEKLIEKGEVDTPAFASLLKAASKVTFGINFSDLLTADTQEFDKLSSDFIKDAKAIFGARITDTDLNTFLTTVPSLLQTDEGKLRVIRNLRIANDAKKLKFNALKDILKENKGKRPRDLAIQIIDRVGDKLEKLSDDFVSGAGLNTKALENRKGTNYPLTTAAVDLVGRGLKGFLATQK